MSMKPSEIYQLQQALSWLFVLFYLSGAKQEGAVGRIYTIEDQG